MPGFCWFQFFLSAFSSELLPKRWLLSMFCWINHRISLDCRFHLTQSVSDYSATVITLKKIESSPGYNASEILGYIWYLAVMRWEVTEVSVYILMKLGIAEQCKLCSASYYIKTGSSLQLKIFAAGDTKLAISGWDYGQ